MSASNISRRAFVLGACASACAPQNASQNAARSPACVGDARLVHVAAWGGPGDGSSRRPFPTIQEAVSSIGDNVMVLVAGGRYREAVRLPSRRGGAPARPFRLLSKDGLGAAHIEAPNREACAIKGLGSRNVVVSGFRIEGGKNGVQFSQSGQDFSACCSGIEVSGNLIADCAEDGVKISQCEDASVVNNVIDACGQQCVDFVNVWTGAIRFNELSRPGRAAAVFAKAGSRDIVIADNHVHDISGRSVAGISAGGYSTPGYARPGSPEAEVERIVIERNRIERVDSYAVVFFGARHATARDNFIVQSTIGAQTARASFGIGPAVPGTAPGFSQWIDISANSVSTPRRYCQLEAGQDIDRHHLTIDQTSPPNSSSELAAPAGPRVRSGDQISSICR